MADDGPGWDFTGGADATRGAGGNPGLGGTPGPGGTSDWSRTGPAPAWDLQSGGGSALPESSVGPPTGLLGAAGAAAVASLVIAAFAGGRPVVAFMGWSCAGFLAVGLLAAFLHVDARRRPSPWYSASSAVRPLRVALLLLAVAGVAANAALFALWFGRR